MTSEISPRKIEKCPSVLFFYVYDVQANYEFLTRTNIKITNIENCLHILNTEHDQLVDTYYYLVPKYGITLINKTTSILKCPKSRIKKIEEVLDEFLDPGLVFSASLSKNSIDEIKRIAEICKKYELKISF